MTPLCHQGEGILRLFNIIGLTKQYLVYGIILAVIVGGIAGAGYFIVYKKIMKGERRIRPLNVLWAGVFFCYLAVMLSATLLDRVSGWYGTRMMPLFYSYREAWYSFSGAEWRNIVLNILLFVPLGFLLPLGIRFFRRFWATYLAGLAVIVLIESAQLILERGVAEADDILNNFLGTMIGYGCYILFREIAAAAKRKRFSILKTAAAQIPLSAVVLAFIGIFIMYDRQELGNLEAGLSSRIDMSDVQVTTDVSYSSNPGTAAVYKIPVYTEEETGKLADDFFSSLGQTLDESRTDLYDETAVYYSTEQNALWIDYAGGTMNYTDYAVAFGDDPEAESYPEPVSGADEATVRSALSAYGIYVPEGAAFQEQTDESSDIPGYEFTVSRQKVGDRFYDGSLYCTLYDGGKLGDISNHILVCKKYKDYPILSEDEAWKRIKSGNFRYFGQSGAEIKELELGAVTLKYVIDSKKYYQPVYSFEASVNGQGGYEIVIPALKSASGGK